MDSSKKIFHEDSSMSDFGLKGPKTPWVCPNDRQLALRAKLKTGWSVKTSQFNTYPKPQPLTETEQQMIISVVKKAEELDLSEQKRVGKLVDRLESLKKLASGNGVTECILCGDSFGLSVFGRSNYKCCDCNKAVCRKCVVELSNISSVGNTKDSVIRLCKICSENRELIKRSGAWFYKSVPKFILPDKKKHYRNSYEPSSSAPLSSEEGRYMSRYLNSHAMACASGNNSAVTSKRMGVFWSKSLRSQSECENDSSSGDENLTTGRKHSTSASEKFLSPRVKSGKKCIIAGDLHDVASADEHHYELSPIKQRSFERFDSSGLNKTALSDNTAQSSGSSSNDGIIWTGAGGATNKMSTQHSLQNHSPYGSIEISLLYDDLHHALHCTIHNCKGLIPMDINGLSDPCCVLKLIPSHCLGGHHRSKTVHKTLNPLFNETVTFYGLYQSHLAKQTLQITVIDDDRWARDCLGFVQIPLQRIKPQQTQSFNMNLENGKNVANEEKEWGRGSILLSLCYMSEKNTLLVGILKTEDVSLDDKDMDNSGSSSSKPPYFRVRLIHDTISQQQTQQSRKAKSRAKSTKQPELQDEFSFKVSIIDLPNLALTISVCEKDNEFIGGLLLSYNSKGARLQHWSDTIDLPNIDHRMWHRLSPNITPGV